MAKKSKHPKHSKIPKATQQPQTPHQTVPPFHLRFEHADQLLQTGQLKHAEHAYRELLAINPTYLPAWKGLGLSLFHQGQLHEAIHHIEHAAALAPDDSNYPIILMGLYGMAGDHAQAEHTAHAVIQAHPQFAGAYDTLGVSLHSQKRYAEAIEAFYHCLHLMPTTTAELHYNLGVALHEEDRFEEAMHHLHQAITINPNYAEPYNILASIFIAKQQYHESLDTVTKALQLKPQFAEAHCTLANALFGLEQYSEAFNTCQRAIQLKPDYAEAYQTLGHILIAENKNTAHAIPAYRQALQLKPNLHAATSLLAYELQKICDWTEWHTLREQVINAVRDDTAKGKINPFSFLSLTDDAALQQQCARQHAKQFFAPLAAKAPLKRLSVQQHHKLRIGYLSADFRQHPLSYLMAEVFELHDRSQFELFGYSIGPNDQSATRARVQAAFDHFIEAKPLSIQETAQRIAEDEIDILVDLTGYTTHSRSQLMALRPAAVQVQFLGNGCTLGTHYVDYLIVDDIIIPESQFNFYDEKIVWLPNSYQPNDRKRPVATIPSRQEAGLPEQGFVFCCFNASYKITPDFFSIWMRLLNAVPQSVLWLLESNAAMSSNLQREAQLRGVDPQRILFAPKKPLAEHLARLSLADLVLDTQYYGAHTTMSDALWVGVPAIIVGLLNNYIFIIIKHMILYIFYFKDSVIRLYILGEQLYFTHWRRFTSRR